MKTFGERLKEVREEKGLSQEKFAKLVKQTLATIRNQEQSRRGIPTETLFDYCKALGVSCSEFEGCTTKKVKAKKGK